MIINHRREELFFSMPKCWSTSLESEASRMGWTLMIGPQGNGGEYDKHTWAVPAVAENYKRYLPVRNPFDRTFSAFNHLKSRHPEFTRKQYLQLFKDTSQWWFYWWSIDQCLNGQRWDNFLKLEHWDPLKYGFDSRNLPHLNAKGNRYGDEWNAHEQEYIRKAHHWDFYHFNYDPDPPRTDFLLHLRDLVDTPKVVVEVGVEMGNHALQMHRVFPESKLVLVDIEFPNFIKQKFPNASLLEMDSVSAGGAVQRNERKADLVYIDALHDAESVYADCKAWWDLIPPGGVLCGHDFNWNPTERAIPGVQEGVERWMAYSSIEGDRLNVLPTSTGEWYIIKTTDDAERNSRSHLGRA